MTNEVQYGARPEDFVDSYNALIYIINSEIKKINTADLVRVIAVKGDTIDVQPLLGNIRANGSMTETSPIGGIRYIQWQFGLNKIKAVPEVGDIGILISCKRDISNVENGNVGSFRQFSLADGIYIGGIEGLNQEPVQTIEFKDSSINITSGTELNITSPQTNVNGTLNVSTGASGLVYTGTQVLTFTNGILTNIS